MMKKISWLWLIGFPIGLIVSLYTTFVLQNLWNWFVVPTLHASSISFWEMYGLLLLVGLLSQRDEETAGRDFADDQRWKGLGTILDACVPESKRGAVEEALREQRDVGIWVEAWMNLGSKVIGKLTANTLVLAIGWGIHIFLA